MIAGGNERVEMPGDPYVFWPALEGYSAQHAVPFTAYSLNISSARAESPEIQLEHGIEFAMKDGCVNTPHDIVMLYLEHCENDFDYTMSDLSIDYDYETDGRGE